MKKIALVALILSSCLSMISCTVEAVEDTNTTPTPAFADGEPGTTPIKPPPPPFP